MSNLVFENQNKKEMELNNFEPKFGELSVKFINEGERKTTSFKINATLHRLLKACAALKDRQEGDLINEAIADLLVKYDYLDLRE